MLPIPAVGIDLATLLPYLEEKFKLWLGTDAASIEAADWFKTLQASSLQLASVVYCVGMPEPIPFEQLYQPTRLTKKGVGRHKETYAYNARLDRSVALAHATTEREIIVSDFLLSKDDAIIYAGPGWGKTTFLHHLFRTLLRNASVLPVLITLRRTNAVENLERIVRIGADLSRKAKRDTLVILVDGYDEIDPNARKRVSDALLKFQGLQLGRFYLTCRSFYDVALITAPELHIKGFHLTDKYAFVTTFLRTFGSKLDPIQTVDDLEKRGFQDFLSHPLLLTLACIVETTSHANHPRSALRLLERALEVLAYKWDDQKIIERHRITILDGRDRIELLKRIAYQSRSPIVDKLRVTTLAKEELSLMHFDRVDHNRVLMETAQFYGIFVPKNDSWEFVHRSLQDFLAAQYWVETGGFAEVKQYRWDSRTAYAACLYRDATRVILAGLGDAEGLATIAEIFSNSPYFKMPEVTEAVFNYYSQPGFAEIFGSDPQGYISGRLRTDFIRLADTRYLNRLAETCAMKRGELADLIAGYCTFELCHRRLRFDFLSYQRMLEGYGSENFIFSIVELGDLKLSNARPLGY